MLTRYLEGLGKLRERVLHDVELAEIRGAETAPFLYAIAAGRAIEASFEEDHRIWIEFWEVDEDESAAPVKEATFESIEAAEQGIRDWLA